MKDQLERLQAQVQAQQLQHNRLVLQMQRLEAQLHQLTQSQQASSKSQVSMPQIFQQPLQKRAWDRLAQELPHLDLERHSAQHGQTKTVSEG